MCKHVVMGIQNFQDTALDFKSSTLTPQGIAINRGWWFNSKDHNRQIEKRRAEQQEVVRKAYRDAMVELGKVITSRLHSA